MCIYNITTGTISFQGDKSQNEEWPSDVLYFCCVTTVITPYMLMTYFLPRNNSQYRKNASLDNAMMKDDPRRWHQWSARM